MIQEIITSSPISTVDSLDTLIKECIRHDLYKKDDKTIEYKRFKFFINRHETGNTIDVSIAHPSKVNTYLSIRWGTYWFTHNYTFNDFHKLSSDQWDEELEIAIKELWAELKSVIAEKKRLEEKAKQEQENKKMKYWQEFELNK